MQIEYNNLYIHFVFTTFNRTKTIIEKNRERIEKYITGIVNNKGCHLYYIYANPEYAQEYETFLKFYQQTINIQKNNVIR